MNLKLKIDGQEKTFVSEFIPARAFRKVLEMNRRINFNDLAPEEMDEIVELIRSVFNKEFTIDQFYDGLPVHELQFKMKEVFLTINGMTTGESSEKK